MNTGKIYIYHHNDHDGIFAAGIMYKYGLKRFGVGLDDIKFIMVDYAKELNFDHIDLTRDKAIFLDYSFSSKHNQEEFKKLLDRRILGNEIIWIDHHKTSIGLFDDYEIHGIRDERLCAAAWTFLYATDAIREFLDSAIEQNLDESDLFHDSDIIPIGLRYIDDYDCWKGIYTETNNFHYGLNLSSPTDPIIIKIMQNNIAVMVDACRNGQIIQQYLNFENEQYHVNMYGFEYTLPKEHGGYKCFCLNRKGNSTMFGSKIDEYDAVIPFYYNNGKWNYSMFTNKDNVDCSAIAKSFGGGGHLKAAGWVSDDFIFKN